MALGGSSTLPVPEMTYGSDGSPSQQAVVYPRTAPRALGADLYPFHTYPPTSEYIV